MNIERIDPSAIYVPTAEWINPYEGLTDEEKLAMVVEFEAPPVVS